MLQRVQNLSCCWRRRDPSFLVSWRESLPPAVGQSLGNEAVKLGSFWVIVSLLCVLLGCRTEAHGALWWRIIRRSSSSSSPSVGSGLITVLHLTPQFLCLSSFLWSLDVTKRWKRFQTSQKENRKPSEIIMLEKKIQLSIRKDVKCWIDFSNPDEFCSIHHQFPCWSYSRLLVWFNNFKKRKIKSENGATTTDYLLFCL